MEQKKRIKRVFSNSDQVMHLWANQSQSDARSTNVFFKGKSIYSYGYHYELGRLIEYKGHTVALINDTGYSKTTAKHICHAYDSVNHLIRFKTKDFDLKAAVIRRQGELVESLMNNFKGIKPAYDINWDIKYFSLDPIKEFNKACDSLGFKDLKLEVDDSFIELIKDHNKLLELKKTQRDALKNSPEQIAKREELRLRKQAAELEKNKEQIEAWLRGGTLTEAVRKLDPQLIRVNGSEVQTSRGARVPLSEAVKALKGIVDGTLTPGSTIGSFSFNRIQGESVVIGCHTINLNQAKQILTLRKV